MIRYPHRCVYYYVSMGSTRGELNTVWVWHSPFDSVKRRGIIKTSNGIQEAIKCGQAHPGPALCYGSNLHPLVSMGVIPTGQKSKARKNNANGIWKTSQP